MTFRFAQYIGYCAGMEPIQLVAAIIIGVMMANIISALLFFGLREAGNHTDDATMPWWALACLIIPPIVFLWSMLILSG